jgi:PHD/YefM family antitoxin component YafN of YafNO toxin-antitoxin module
MGRWTRRPTTTRGNANRNKGDYDRAITMYRRIWRLFVSYAICTRCGGWGRMRISSAEFVRKFSLLCDEALTQPLIISRHGRDRLVVMSLAMYREVTTPPRRSEASSTRTRRPSSDSKTRQPQGSGKRQKPSPNALTLASRLKL